MLLDAALLSFTRAADHRNDYYKADALYQRSKTRWRRWMTDRDRFDLQSELETALKDARDAVKKANDAKFATWLEFVEDFDARAPTATDSVHPSAAD